VIGKRNSEHNDAHNDALAISERELGAMTAELDTLHKETFPGVAKTLQEFTANLSHLRTGSRNTARRSFLLGAGGLAVAGGLAACSSSGGASTPSSAGSTRPGMSDSSSAGAEKYTGDLKVVALAAALENLAVAAYNGALQLAGQHKLGKVPPAVATFATTALAQHKDHAAAWNGVLAQARLPKITGTPLTIAKTEVAKLQSAKSVADVAALALSLEDAAAQTYTFATSNVTDPGGIMTAATIQPVEAMHAAILSFVLGKYPVPAADIGTSGAVPPSALTV
jgi:hypothetical protein